ncbi:MAG: GreA/GreB family elongation factor [Myxococcota bacterium]
MSKRLTKNGYERLKSEYEELLFVKRPKVVGGIATAAAEGDRSENAEYIYGKKHLREIDKRLAYLGGLLKDVKVVAADQLALVTVKDEAGETRVFRIVGQGETEFYPGSISEDSPIAKAVLDKRAGETAEVHRPKGLWQLEVVKIV